jgi:hypothetical protein
MKIAAPIRPTTLNTPITALLFAKNDVFAWLGATSRVADALGALTNWVYVEALGPLLIEVIPGVTEGGLVVAATTEALGEALEELGLADDDEEVDSEAEAEAEVCAVVLGMVLLAVVVITCALDCGFVRAKEVLLLVDEDEEEGRAAGVTSNGTTDCVAVVANAVQICQTA